MQKKKLRNKLVVAIGLLVLIFLFLERIPVKKSINYEDAYKETNIDNVYICEYEATTGPSWIIYKKDKSKKQLVCLEGNVPNAHLNKQTFFHFARNYFLIRGETVGKQLIDGEGNIQNYYGKEVEECLSQIESMDTTYECCDIINVTEWEIITPINRGDSFRFWAPMDYLSICDFIG